MNRRNLLKTAGLALAGSAVLPFSSFSNDESTSFENNTVKPLSNKRKLGKLEVSAVGMGVQNMHRNYSTLIPYRPEMIKILQTAYDRGNTFIDIAEDYSLVEGARG